MRDACQRALPLRRRYSRAVITLCQPVYAARCRHAADAMLMLFAIDARLQDAAVRYAMPLRDMLRFEMLIIHDICRYAP